MQYGDLFSKVYKMFSEYIAGWTDEHFRLGDFVLS